MLIIARRDGGSLHQQAIEHAFESKPKLGALSGKKAKSTILNGNLTVKLSPRCRLAEPGSTAIRLIT